MAKEKVNALIENFGMPLFVIVGSLIFWLLSFLNIPLLPVIAIYITVLGGSYQLFRDTWESMIKKQFALDYIAIIAIAVSLFTGQFWVAAVLALMIASGRTLEEYGAKQARKSLTSLIDRIPNEVLPWEDDQAGAPVKIESIEVGQKVYIRKGEVIPLDGKLFSESAYIDESSLTGEPYPVEKITGDLIRSGTVNTGEALVLEVTIEEKDSTYRKIVGMVKRAEKEKAPLVRLADKYSTYFTAITFLIAAIAFLLASPENKLQAVLAVLVVATPCPLILATPIALMGGVNASAKRRIIVKRLASLEVLGRVNTIIFDKTGTITLGKPKLTNVKIFDQRYSEGTILSIAEAIERSSLHPLAKAVVDYAHMKQAEVIRALNIKEIIGEGISGEIDGTRYMLSKVETQTNSDMAISLAQEGRILAVFSFEDQLKEESVGIVKNLTELGLQISIFTGDKIEIANRVAQKLGHNITVLAECTPEDKQRGIERLKKAKKVTAMVGDGINDAPALALADVGMVFSNEEQTAASEAADIVFLHGDFSLVLESFTIAKRTVNIAMQSIMWGIGLSIVAQVFAAMGYIPPLIGAGVQEAIDVAVILNALRASK